ncbi:MAG: response regulator [Chloroflexi bacterium]|nr:response regulator [Chloroflexota bacterium]
MAKILIAEDEPDIRELVMFTLQSFGGHEVVSTQNGEEALHKAPEVMPDLILMDVRMPRMTGYEACVAMKQNPKISHIPVVFLSAKGQDEEVSQGLSAGAVAYILKPFEPAILVEKVAEILAEQVS